MKTQITIETTTEQEQTISQLSGARGGRASRVEVRDHFEAFINAELVHLAAIAERQHAAIEAILEDASAGTERIEV